MRYFRSCIIGFFASLALIFGGLPIAQIVQGEPLAVDAASKAKTYKVISVIDGDTIKVKINGKVQRVRFIGINAPEATKEIECYGKEATKYLKKLLNGKKVKLIKDNTQKNKDIYGRLLRYVYVGKTDIGLKLINGGYAEEYTFKKAYKKQKTYKKAAGKAQKSERGLWGDACNDMIDDGEPGDIEIMNPTEGETPGDIIQVSASCVIKGNISSSGERIYHVPGGAFYDKTEIDIYAGERWFCTEDEAILAGWRQSLR